MGKSSPCIPCEMCPCVVCLWKESKEDGRGEEKENVERDDGRNFFLLGNGEVLPSNLEVFHLMAFPGWVISGQVDFFGSHLHFCKVG